MTATTAIVRPAKLLATGTAVDRPLVRARNGFRSPPGVRTAGAPPTPRARPASRRHPAIASQRKACRGRGGDSRDEDQRQERAESDHRECRSQHPARALLFGPGPPASATNRQRRTATASAAAARPIALPEPAASATRSRARIPSAARVTSSRDSRDTCRARICPSTINPASTVSRPRIPSDTSFGRIARSTCTGALGLRHDDLELVPGLVGLGAQCVGGSTRSKPRDEIVRPVGNFAGLGARTRA